MSGFDGFLGNKTLIARLRGEIADRTLPHAYILEGAPGFGKRTLAKLICAAAVCRGNGAPCMTCISCDKIMRGQSPDVIYVEADRDRVQLGVDVIRRVREDAVFAPNDLDAKFYIFPAADTMNPQAQNALLKLLEEPPAAVHFLLLCTDADSLLSTIRSRAPTLRLEPLPDELISAHLLEAAPAARELAEKDREAFETAVRMAGGSLGAALELCEPERAKAAIELRRTAWKYLSLLTAGSGRSELAFFEFASRLDLKQRAELAALYSLLRTAVRDLSAAKLTNSFKPLFYTSEAEARAAAESLTVTKLNRLYDLFQSSREALDRNINPALSLTGAAMHALAIMSGRSVPSS